MLKWLKKFVSKKQEQKLLKEIYGDALRVEGTSLGDDEYDPADGDPTYYYDSKP